MLEGVSLNKIRKRENTHKLENPVEEFKFTLIAIKYLRGSFLIDIFACLPLLVYEVAVYGFDMSLEVKIQIV